MRQPMNWLKSEEHKSFNKLQHQTTSNLNETTTTTFVGSDQVSLKMRSHVLANSVGIYTILCYVQTSNLQEIYPSTQND